MSNLDEARMLAELAKLPDPELLQANQITDPIGADAFYCARTVVGLLTAERERCARVADGAITHDAAPHNDIGRAALLVLSPKILAELLQLPDGCHIDHAVAPHDQPGVLHLRVRGAGWPTKAGWVLPKARGTVTRHHAEDGSVLRHTIDWGFPKDEEPSDSQSWRDGVR